MQKENYIKYVEMAKKLIGKYGTTLEVICGANIHDDDEPFEVDTDQEVTYTTTGVIMPPVRGIYFQGTRFGLHNVMDNGLFDDKFSCFLLPVYDSEGKIIDISTATHIKRKSVDGVDESRFKVYFCDTMKPADKVILFSYGLGR